MILEEILLFIEIYLFIKKAIAFTMENRFYFGLVLAGWFGWRWLKAKRLLRALKDKQSNTFTQIIVQAGAEYIYCSDSGNYRFQFDGKVEVVSPAPLKIKSIGASLSAGTPTVAADLKKIPRGEEND